MNNIRLMQEGIHDLKDSLVREVLTDLPSVFRNANLMRRNGISELRRKYCDVLNLDPFTHYSLLRPRGYAGDAVLMDMIYRLEQHDVYRAATNIGQEIYRYTIRTAAAEAVRQRRVLAAHLIDDCCEQSHGACIMSVACGHLRELELSSRFPARQFHRFVGLDQDAISIEEVARQYGPGGVEGRCAGVSELLKDEIEGKFDLIYSLGLFDYLQKPQARRLIASLVQQLNVGGRLVIANFLDDVEEAGYMEAFMDWFLIYRSLETLEELIPRSVQECCDFRVYSPIPHIGVIDLQRR